MKSWEGIYGQSSSLEILTKLVFTRNIPHAFLFTGLEGIGKTFTAIRFAQLLNKVHETESRMNNSNDVDIEYQTKALSNHREVQDLQDHEILDLLVLKKQVNTGTRIGMDIKSESTNNICNSIDTYSEPYIKYIFPLPRGKNETDESSAYEKLTQDEISLIREEIAKKSANHYHKMSIPNANVIKVSSIRDINKFISLNFDEISYRIILIEDSHLMNEESQNALLKNLEEPPEGVVFILTTSYPGLLRETIRSRCWSIKFKPLTHKEVSNILQKKYRIEESLAVNAASFSNGSVTTALELLDYDLNIILEKTISILRFALGQKLNSAIGELKYFTGEDAKNNLRILISLIITWLNDVQRKRSGGQNFYYSSYLDTIEKFGMKSSGLDFTNIITKLEVMKSSIKNNVNPSLIGLNVIHELSALIKKN